MPGHARARLPGVRAVGRPVLDTERGEPRQVVALERGEERVGVARLDRLVGPHDVGERGQAGERGVVEASGRVEVLGPQLGLGAEELPGKRVGVHDTSFGERARRQGFEPVDVADGVEEPDGDGLVGAVPGPVVEVDGLLGGHDDVVPGGHGLEADGPAAPGGDDRLAGEGVVAGAERLVPDDGPPSGVDDVLREGTEEPAVEVGDVREPEVGRAPDDVRVGAPQGGGDLVAAERDVRRVEHVHDLVEDLAEEPEALFGGVEHLGADAPGGADLVRLLAGPEERVRGHRRFHVSRHVDLGDDRHAVCARVPDDLAQVVLRVETAVGPAVEDARPPRPDVRPAPPRADLDEAGVPARLEPPALVVGEVELHDVEVVGGRELHEAEDVVLGQEVAGHVEQDAAPRVSGGVVGVEPAGQGDRRVVEGGTAEGAGSRELPQRLGGGVRPGKVRSPDRDPFRPGP